LYHEQWQELRQASEYHAANAAGRGDHGGFGRGLGGGGRGRGRGDLGRGNGIQDSNYNAHSNVQFQLCRKKCHVVKKCYKRFAQNFSGEDKTAAPATTSYGIDTNWYADSGTTDHITSDLEKLSMRDKYLGHDQVHTTSGSGMRIQHIGNSIFHIPSRDLMLKNILHVPTANKNLISIHRLARDNHVFLELHPWFFLIKDQGTKRILHHGKVERGLYPLKSLVGVQALCSVKVSYERWHNRLGHHSSPIVQRVLLKNNLSFDGKSSSGSLFDACQKGRMHQLPYPKSNRGESKFPLELIFSDVWGSTPVSIGNFSYYVRNQVEKHV
jgi:hypothetical protein